MSFMLNAAMAAHVLSGGLAVLAGAIALFSAKGRTAHVGAGRVFALAMALSSALGAGLGLVKADTFYITFHAGILGVTLIASGWLAGRMRSGRPDAATLALGIVNLANAGALVALGVHALGQTKGVYLGFAAGDYFFLSGMAMIGVLGDASLLIRSSLSQRHRIARHLWRMCLGFFIAAGSAFGGPGASAFPQALRDSGVLSLPELVIILALVFWLARTLWKGAPAAVRPEG